MNHHGDGLMSWFESRCAARQSCIDVSAWQALDIQTRFAINVYFHRGRKHSLRQGLILAASLSLYFHSSLLHIADTIVAAPTRMIVTLSDILKALTQSSLGASEVRDQCSEGFVAKAWTR